MCRAPGTMRSCAPTRYSLQPTGRAAPSPTLGVAFGRLRGRSYTISCAASHQPEGVASLDGIHRLLAYGAVAVTVAGIGWSLLLVFAGRAGGPGFERLQAVVVSVLVVGAASGLVLLAVGARPTEGLHLLYAILAIALIPLARSFLGRANARAAGALLFAAFVVLGGVAYRLFTTG